MRIQRRVSSFVIFALLVFAAVFPSSAAQSGAGLSSSTEVQILNNNSLSSDWLSAVQGNLQQAEYRITWQESTALKDLSSAFQAPNRAHNLRTYFTSQGIRVVSRQAAATPEWEWGLKLERFGVADRMEPVGQPVDMVAEGNRFEYHYLSDIQEWYINDARGLEQGFTIAKPPAGAGMAPLVLDLVISGNLNSNVEPDGQAIEFISPGGVRVLRYSDLKVFDAVGKSLPAHLNLAEDGRSLQIVIQDSGAAYPITVDPLATSPSWTVESNQAGAQLGTSVATAGDVNGDGYDDVIVGAPLFDSGYTDGGVAAIFFGSASGPSAGADWQVQGGSNSAQLGRSVDTAGDVNGDGYMDVIVGAPGADAAYVFYGGNPMNTTSDWTGTGSSGDHYGFSVACAGDVNGDGYFDVIVGAYTAGNGGRAYVYHGSAGGVSAAPNWQAEAGQAGAQLGYSVSRAGDVNGNGYGDVIIGAPGFDAPNTDEGIALLWYGWGSGVNGGTPGFPGNSDWNAESEQNNARMGASVSWAGDVNGDGYGDLVIGAPGYSNGNNAEGSAFVWHGSSSGPNLGSPGTPSNAARSFEGGADNANAGSSVGLAGDANGDGYADIIHGAPGLNSAYVHFGSSSGVQAVAAWTGTGAGNFGAAVNTVGDVNGDGYWDIIVGAPLFESASPSQNDEGRAAVYFGGSYGLSTTSAWQFTVAVSGTQVGSSVSTAGDVNGDGYDDVIVGAWIYDGGQADEGAVFVFHGSANGLSLTPSWTAESNQGGARLGTSVSTAGDVNGDGYSDIIAGARSYDNVETEEGAVFVWYGSSTGLVSPSGSPANANWMAESNQANAWFGDVVNTAGDVNGDGCSEVMIGSSRYDNPEVNEGAVFVWYGSVNGLGPSGNPTNASWMAETDQDYAGNMNMLTMGQMMGPAGDVNGDGFGDVIMGFRLFDNPQSDEGIVVVWYGSTNGLGPNGNPGNADWFAESNQTASFFGDSAASAGDVNGDGYADVIASATHYDRPEIGEGVVFVWYGSAAGINGGTFGDPTNSAWSAESNTGGAFYGEIVGTAGDVNGDGYGDVFISSVNYDYGGAQNNGIVDVYHGSAGGLSTTYAWRGLGNGATNDNFGHSVNTAGDVNGDGYSDLIVGEHSYDGASSEQGRAYVFYGNEGDGFQVVPQQRRADNSAPATDGGQSISPTQVRLAVLGRSPFGVGNVRMEWEIKPFGTAFNGSGLGQSTWQNSGLQGYAFNELISGLSFETVYHWRVRILARPYNAPATGAVTYRSRWLTGSTFFTALSGTQAVGAGTTQLLGQAAYVNVTTQGSLSSLTLRGFPDTAHPKEDFRGGGANMLNRYFNISPNAGASGYTLRLCLNYAQAEVTGLNENLLRLCRWTGSAWTCPNRSASSDTTANLVCADNVTQLSDWTIGQVGPTSVTLVKFDAASGRLGNPISKVLVAGLAISLLGLIWLIRRRKN